MKKAHEIKGPGGLKMLHQHGPTRYEMPTEEELKSIPKSDLDKLEEAVRTNEKAAIQHLQKVLDAMPWKELGQGKPKLMPPSGKIDAETQKALDILKKVSEDFKEPNLIKMFGYIDQGDYFNAQSLAYVAKTQLTKMLFQHSWIKKVSPEIIEKYPGLRMWTREEMFDYLKKTPYPGYFPTPWDWSYLGKKYDGSFGCDPSKERCDRSHYNDFMKWGPPEGTMGLGTAYDPRLFRNMDKYPNIWSNRAIRYRMQKNIPSPHIPSPGTGPWMDLKNLPKGKRFLDEEDKQEYFRLLKLYNQFKREAKERGTPYIAPPSAKQETVQSVASLIADKYYIK